MTQGLTDEDTRLWSLVTRTIKGIHPNRAKTDIPPAPVKVQPPGPGPKRRAREGGPPVAAPAPQPRAVVNTPKATPGQDVDIRTQARLRRGQMEIQGKIDLHGHRVHEAYFALRDFITEQFNRDARCILVIHGKGSITGEAKIKNEMPRWLQEWPDKVLMHSRAQPKDGGDGASYVLLRRKR